MRTCQARRTTTSTTKIAVQDEAHAIAVVTDPQSLAASRHEYAAGRLLAVGQIIAARFRQAAS
jgi:hypothetical protein